MLKVATLTEKILDYLQLQAEDTVDLLDILFSDRRTAMRKARRSIIHGPPEFKTRWSDWYQERQKFYSLLNQLKRDGLVLKKKHGAHSQWSISNKGIKHLLRIKSKPQTSDKLPKRRYIKKETIVVSIVSFDVPERERKKRRWLRTNLLALGFQMLQKSVWFGKVEIPEDFMQDLRKYDLLSYVHIFSINKTGTIVEKS